MGIMAGLCAASEEDRAKAVIEAVTRSNTDPCGPSDGIVAVKVQYPDALPLFERDLKNIRRLAGLVSQTEIRFDLVSAVDELSAQVKFEFQFERCSSVLWKMRSNYIDCIVVYQGTRIQWVGPGLLLGLHGLRSCIGFNHSMLATMTAS
jgi:hypothetical protein